MGTDSHSHAIQKGDRKYKGQQNSHINKKPDFFIVGAGKSGTTSMHEYLKQHPGIFMPTLKDAAFFGSDIKYKHGRLFKDLDDYLRIFRSALDNQIIGDSCVAYLESKNAPQEIKEFNSAAKIIIMLRNPAEQMYSQYRHMLWEGNEVLDSFSEALDAEEARKRGERIPANTNYPPALFYREVASYSKKVKRYFDVFGRENVHIIIFDDFKSDTAGVYRDTLYFLGVNEDFCPEFERVNVGKAPRSRMLQKMLSGGLPKFITTPIKKIIPWTFINSILEKLKNINSKKTQHRPLDKELKRQLLQDFEQEINELENIIGRDLSFWRK
ncbi:MAG: sulfotransferase [Candidatus Spechtbacterales bacterium]|nr:sulfotransferase [Candidatus Spechtbacterales bacterium]